jgi:two-component system CheB/CheR fusion protein
MTAASEPGADPLSTSASFCVVGIGASAGGLEALEEFFENVPVPAGMAFVVVQHLSPDFKSMMDELLARRTKLPVRLVEDGMRVVPDHVYLIPPGKEMIVSGGRLLLSERDAQQELTLPIDVFFRSLAQDCGSRAVAIVLSGGGSDGSRGVRDVHAAGGLVIVQDVQSAQFDGMPRTAREAGVARWVLSPRDMPRVLLEHAKDTRAPLPKSTSGARLQQPAGLDAIYEMLEREYGLDFTDYKPSTVTRRIERRLALAHTEDVDKYVGRLKDEHEELDTLYRDLLIGVTRFFRNEEAFDLLERQILPELLRRGPRDLPLRIWVAGCATGEEAYSLAISVQEALSRPGTPPRPVKIFATDVHHGSLERAARGVYNEDALVNVPGDRIDRYFHRSGTTFQIVPEVRQTIVFAPHNVIRDAPFTRVDLVSCRNLLIYLQPPAQQKALSLFHFAMNRGGILFLGPSESPGHLAPDYEVVDKHWRLYRKFSDVRVPVAPRLKPARTVEPRAVPHARGVVSGPAGNSLSHLVGTYDSLLEHFMPPSLLVDEAGRLVHAFGGASAFLRHRDGRQGLDVCELVSEQLKMVLVGGLKRALNESGPLVFAGVRVNGEDDRTMHRITLRRVIGRNGGPPHVIVSFEPTSLSPADPRPSDAPFDMERASRERLQAMDAELRSTRENLQAAIEQLEASNEELQASNEELLSSNEELQSTNEELQSVNEELYTVNAEHQRKIAELVELTNDVNNLLSSTDVGTIFLDADLKIRKFTPQVAEAFRLVPHDVGRSIETFAHSLQHPGLVDDLRQCVATGDRVERELRGVQGRAFFLRILPYRAKGTVDGIVLTLIDVSGMKATEDALFHERHLLDSLLFSVPDAIYFKDDHGNFVRANPALATRLGLCDPREAVGKTTAQLVGEEAARAETEADEAVVRTGQAQHYALEKHSTQEGGDRWDLVTRLPLRDQDGAIVGVIGIIRDVTREKVTEEKIQEAIRRRDQFLAMLSHELRNPLSAIVTAVRLLKVRGPQASAHVIETLERQSGQMARLLDDLLEASRVTQNKIELRKISCDLRAIGNDAVDAMRSVMEARGVDLAVEMDPDPLPVDGDPARLQQIHVNLLNNAAKYTPRGGHVLLRLAREGDDAVIRVHDDGAGIQPHMLDSIFELFVQSNRTLDRADGGLGVGLTLVRSLVAMHGGTVAAHSDGIGKGSEFVVRLPVAAAIGGLSSPPPRQTPPKNAGLRVVIIEDNVDSCQMLSTFLEHAGFDCKVAGTGQAGLALIEECCPDVAIIDIGLPEMDGLEVARRVRMHPAHARARLIALSGYGHVTDSVAAREAGFDSHMVKPVDLDQLLARLSDGVTC